MAWGYGEDGEQFFRGWALDQVPPGFSFVDALAIDGEPGICFDPIWGPAKRVARLVASLKHSGERRQQVVRELRASYWWVRNRRWCDSAKRVHAEERIVLNVVQLLELAGVSVRDIVTICQCQQHRCCCNGCDCWDGQRLL